MSKTDELLAKASKCFADGDSKYEEGGRIIARLQASPHNLSYREIGARLDPPRSYEWVRRVSSARDNDAPIDWGSGSNKRDEVTAKTLEKANDEQVEKIVASLPDEAVDRVARAVEQRVPQRDWTTEPTPPKSDRKSAERRLHDAVWQLWLIQDELQDAVISGEERVRMLGAVGSGRTFLDAIEARLEHGELDDELASLLAEAKPS